MAVRRGEMPTDNFTIIANEWLRDARLSWKAKGLLAYIVSHRVGYALSVEQIIEEGDDGRDAVRAGLRELEMAGYLTRQQRRGEGGKIVSTDYLIGEPVVGKPADGCDQEEQDVSPGQTSDGKPGGGKPASKKTTSEKTKEDPPSSRERAPRATRIPDPFVPDDDLRAWYRENVGDRIDGLAEHERFMDYWRAKPGRDGTKTDWPATWRNWMRRAAERPARGRELARQGSGYQTAQERSQDRLRAAADLARIAEEYLERTGGNPEDPKQVNPLVEELKRHPEKIEALLSEVRNPNGSASRTPGTYSGGSKTTIEGELAAGSREVTSHAADGDADAPR